MAGDRRVVYPDRCFVYVVAETEGDPRYLKIGVSKNVLHRFRVVTANPRIIEIVAAEPFDTRDLAVKAERYLHERFADWFKRGEWYGEGVANFHAFARAVVKELEAIALAPDTLKSFKRSSRGIAIDRSAPEWWLEGAA